jgi:isopentenyldiphosphate isomerase
LLKTDADGGRRRRGPRPPSLWFPARPADYVEASASGLLFYSIPPGTRIENCQSRIEYFNARQIELRPAFPLCIAATSLNPPSMSEEVFDVVNERDEVIGQAGRSEVHRLGLRHRAAHVLVFNARGLLFLQKRSQQKDRHPGVWDSSAAGHVDHGESYEACAVRETAEELGLVLSKTPERLFKLQACAATGEEFLWVYRCQAEGPFALPPSEIERGDWFQPGFISRWIQERPDDFAPTFPLIWDRLNREPETGRAP